VSSKGGFRSDIQGMRALAVGLVILAHAGFRTAEGGFVGVDIFFVISGFLIVGLLVREAGESRRISIVDFYARRARRVLPAATVVLVVTCFASAWFLPFVRSLEVVKDAIWAAFFGANIRFSLVETDYFAQGSPPSPVQHYWSLAVEEQFYVVIPVLLLLVTVGLRRWGHALPEHTDRALRRTVLLVLGLVSLISLAYSIHITSADPAAAYFSTPARAWELGIGGLLATALWGRTPQWSRSLTELLGLIGLGMMAVATLRYSAATPFPGSAALLPVLGCALMLAAGSSASAPRTYWFRWFSLKPFRILGDWSYSLYLWHFPVLLIARAHWVEPGLSRPHLVFALLLILALSGLSYHFIEEPFRRGVVWRPRLRAIGLYPVSLALVIVSAVGAQAWVDQQIAARDDNPAISAEEYAGRDLSRSPAVALVEASLLAAKDDKPVPGRLQPDLENVRKSIAPLGDCDYRTGTTRLCPFGDPDAKRTIVVFGDSHARAWGPALDEIGKKHGYVVYQFVYSGCPANAENRPNKNREEFEGCAAFVDWARGQIEEMNPDLVFVANNYYPGWRKPKGEQESGLATELERLQEIAKRVVMVENIPEMSGTPGQCLSSRDVDLGDCIFEPRERTVRGQAAFREVAESVGVKYVDAMRWFCSDGQCPSVIGDYIPQRDSTHISVEYSRHLADPLARVLDLD